MKKYFMVLFIIILLVGCQKYDDTINSYKISEEQKVMNSLNGLNVNLLKFNFNGAKKSYIFKEMIISVDDKYQIKYHSPSSGNFNNHSSNTLYQGYKDVNSKLELVTYLDNQGSNGSKNRTVGGITPELKDYTDYSIDSFEFKNTILREDNIYVTMLLEKTNYDDLEYHLNNNFINNGLLNKSKLKKSKAKNIVMFGFSIVECQEDCVE